MCHERLDMIECTSYMRSQKHENPTYSHTCAGLNGAWMHSQFRYNKCIPPSICSIGVQVLYKYVCNHIGYLPSRSVSCWQFPLEYLTASAARRLSVHHVCKVKQFITMKRWFLPPLAMSPAICTGLDAFWTTVLYWSYTFSSSCHLNTFLYWVVHVCACVCKEAPGISDAVKCMYIPIHTSFQTREIIWCCLERNIIRIGV